MTRLTRTESRQRTRTLLLDAAERVFARRGYRGASLDEIAAEAGFSKGAVYSNFSSKEELFLALIDRRRTDDRVALGAALRVPDNEGRAPLFAETAAPTDAAAWTWGLLALEFFLYAAREPEVRARLASQYEDQRASIAEALRATWPALASAPLGPRDIATIVMALSTGLGVQAVLDPAAIDPELFARALDALVTSAAGRRKARSAARLSSERST
jgi:AcrR family transcriptional regulator